MSRNRRIITGLFALIALVFAAPRALAHDFGAMLVTISVDNNQLTGSVRIDPAHLPAALRTQLTGGGGGTPAQRDAAITAFRSQLAEASTLTLALTNGEDAINRHPALTLITVESTEPATAGLMLFAFTEAAPANLTAIAWRCELDLGRYLVRFSKPGDAEPTPQWLSRAESSDLFAIAAPTVAPSTLTHTILQYIALGFTHIIPEGYDHILFILGLFLLCPRLKPVVAQATAFTIAHSITLALAVTGVIKPSPAIVEPLIAATIVLVAIENIVMRDYRAHRALIAFVFGLVHGLGFAGVLQELGLPSGQLAPALISFNVGVELGQIAVIVTAMLAFGLWTRNKNWYRARVVIPMSIAIGLIALYWTIERLG